MDKSISEQLLDAARAHLEMGNRPTGLLMTPRSVFQLKKEYEGWNQVVPSPVDVIIDKVNTPYSALNLIISPYCPPDTIYVANASDLREAAERTAQYYQELIDATCSK